MTDETSSSAGELPRRREEAAGLLRALKDALRSGMGGGPDDRGGAAKSRQRGRLTWKAVGLGAVCLGLLIPLEMVQNLIWQRATLREHVAKDIAHAWGEPQLLSGPVLIAPRRGVGSDSDPLVILPEDLKVAARLTPETRRRGIYEAVVYRAEITATGRFVLPSQMEALAFDADWFAARIAVGLNDLRSVVTRMSISVDGAPHALKTGPDPLGQARRSVRTDPIDLTGRAAPGEIIDFVFTIGVNGSGSFSVIPTGATTEMTVRSDWPDPSFIGDVLPTERTVTPDGFEATWRTTHLGRAYGQLWAAQGSGREILKQAAGASAFGVKLLRPAGGYQKAERSAKYGLLLFATTFALLFATELMTGARIHILQYGLIGLALSLFYLLLLSTSEILPFAAAYGLSAAAITLQSGGYARAILGGLRQAAWFVSGIAGLYGGLYVILSMEERALLAGSVLLFILLTALMAATRKLGGVAPAT